MLTWMWPRWGDRYPTKGSLALHFGMNFLLKWHTVHLTANNTGLAIWLVPQRKELRLCINNDLALSRMQLQSHVQSIFLTKSLILPSHWNGTWTVPELFQRWFYYRATFTFDCKCPFWVPPITKGAFGEIMWCKLVSGVALHLDSRLPASSI